MFDTLRALRLITFDNCEAIQGEGCYHLGLGGGSKINNYGSYISLLGGNSKIFWKIFTPIFGEDEPVLRVAYVFQFD